ncbi:lck-interacting transmembrane adapter 1 [Rhynchocyon petersi]
MGLPLSSAPFVLWVIMGFILLLGLWALCTTCHRKQAPRPQAGLEGAEMAVDMSLLRQTHIFTRSKSDTRLHELHWGPPGSRAPRPASMDILHLQWLEGHRCTHRLSEASLIWPHQELPRPLPILTSASTASEATYSNVGLAALPRASLAASPDVWSGAQLTTGWARLEPGTGPRTAEYACVQKLKGAGKAEVMPSMQVDTLYSRVNKQGRPGLKGMGSWPGQLPRIRGVYQETLENVYESIQEVDHQLQRPPAGC